jgi:hypothetical protein
MDQLKVFWAGVVKFHFWILMVVVALASFGTFYMSRQAIDQEVVSRINTVEGKYRNVSSLNGEVATHPNDFSDEEMKKSVALMTGDVKSAWESQYNRQRGIMVWPEDVGADETLKKLNQFRPIEFFLEYSNPPKPDPLEITEREVYRDYVKNVFPKIAKVVGADWTASLTSSGAGYGGGESGYGVPPGTVPGATAPTAPLVIWETASQSTLQKEIVPWFNPTTPPSTLEICYTQEDLWVLDGVLQVIKRTNGDARENFQAPIKQIEWIRLGKAARADAGDVQGVEALLAGSVVAANPYGAGAPVVSPYGGVGVPVRPDPAEGRYVDSDYKPVPASRLRSAMKSSAPADALFAVAKRIPVQFRVKMDPTKIASLISECGNNPLLIEVKQVRVNGKESAAGASASYGAFAMGGGGGIDGGDSGGGGGGDSTAAATDPYGGSASGFDTTTDAKTGDVPVEVYGIVYLFNPVDIQKLGLDKVKAETELDTTVEGASAPAAVAPAAAPAPVAPGTGVPPVPAQPAGVPPAVPVPAEGIAPVNTPEVSMRGVKASFLSQFDRGRRSSEKTCMFTDCLLG